MKLIINLLIMLGIILWTCSCSFKAFEGTIKEVREDTICIPNQCFKLLPNAPRTKVGNRAVFKETNNRKIVNCIRIK